MIRISRRRFLGVTAGATALTGSAVVAAHALHGSASASSGGLAGGGTLVLVALYGGNDGLNTVIPYQDSAYLSGRPTLGYQPHDVLALDSALGLNPGLPGLKSLWDAKQLAIVRGVGYPSPSYSHFRSMDIWQSGVPDRQEQTGWLGRWLDGLGGADPLAALSIGPTLPKLLQGASASGASVPTSGLALARPSLEAAFTALETTYPGEAALAARAATSGADLLTVLHSVKAILGTTASSGTGLAGQLDMVSKLIKGGLPTRVYVVSAPGFDTHVTEKQNHQRLMTEIDGAITTFVRGMHGDPHGQNVVLMTFSEFGRRVAENASGGTDHGSASPLFVAGPAVRGGYYGEEPSLTDLDSGNLKFTTDFRSVYATVLSKVVRTDPARVLGGTFPELNFV